MPQCPQGIPNITETENMGECLYQCQYQYHYGLANVRATHNNGYISIAYQTQNKDFPVMFKEQEFSVSELRMYSPSLHKFSGKNTDAELVIVHSLCSPEVDPLNESSQFVWENAPDGKSFPNTLGDDSCFYTYDSLNEAKAQCSDPQLMPGSSGDPPMCAGIVDISGTQESKKCSNHKWQLRNGEMTDVENTGQTYAKILRENPTRSISDCPPTLYVCIPLSSGAPTAGNSSIVLNEIIRASIPLQLGYHTDVFSFDSPFNLNEFIPNKKYFSYII